MGSVLRWAALAVLFVLVLEATARAEDWVRYRTPFFSRIVDEAELMVRDSDGAHGRPDARYMKWRMNSLGLRGPEVHLSKAPGTIRIATVGASEAFGLFESPGREFPRQLEDTLAALAARDGACGEFSGKHFQVLNAALPGMSLPTIEADLRLRLKRYSLDVVVVYPSPAQYLENWEPTVTPPDSSGKAALLPWTRMFYPRSKRRLREQVKLLLPEHVKTWLRERETARRIQSQPAGWRFEEPPPERIAAFEQDLRQIVKTVRANGSIPILVTHANAFRGPYRHDRALQVTWERFFPRATGEILVTFDSLANLSVLKIAAEMGVGSVDVVPHLGDRRWFGDFSHFTDEGAGRVARTIAPVVARATGEGGGCTPPSSGPIRGSSSSSPNPVPRLTN